MKKERTPQIVKRGKPGTGYPPPILPHGTRFEFWHGVVGIDRALTIYDRDSAAAHVGEIDEKDRKVIAQYMIALWKRFEEGK